MKYIVKIYNIFRFCKIKNRPVLRQQYRKCRSTKKVIHINFLRLWLTGHHLHRYEYFQ